MSHPAERIEPGYPLANGRFYLDVFRDLHVTRDIGWYLEIGTETGKALVPVEANVVSVDPTFQIRHDVIGRKGEAHFFQKTSDDFFASGFLDRTGIRVDLAFLDGMHLFEYLLRDFINAERYMVRGGRVLMHDCLPFNGAMTVRNRDRLDVPWTGDVWKILPILAAYRPDLKVSPLNASPTGLVLVENFDPANEALSENYDRIVEEYMDLTLDAFGLERFARELPVMDCEVLIGARAM